MQEEERYFTEEEKEEFAEEPIKAEPVREPGRASRLFSRVGDIVVSKPAGAAKSVALRTGRRAVSLEREISGREEEEEKEKFTPLTAQEIEILAQQMLSQGLFSTLEEARAYIRNQQASEALRARARPKAKRRLTRWEREQAQKGKITRLPSVLERGTGFFTDVGKVPKIPVAPEPTEPSILDDIGEELVFDPWGEPVREGDLGGEGILTSPVQTDGGGEFGLGTVEGFLKGFMGLGLGEEKVRPVQELNIGVPGGLSILGIIQDTQGRTGYRIIWQGEELNWFPVGKG